MRRYLLLLLVTLLPALLGCTTWQAVALPAPSEALTVITSGPVQVALASGDALRGKGLSLRGDSLWLGRSAEDRVALTRGQVVSIVRLVPDLARSTEAIGFAVVTIGVVLYVISNRAPAPRDRTTGNGCTLEFCP